jgi:hypothetical protein
MVYWKPSPERAVREKPMQPTNEELRLQQEVRKEVEELFGDPRVSDVWLNTENAQLGGQKPGELIANGKARLVRDLIQSVRYGAMT